MSQEVKNYEIKPAFSDERGDIFDILEAKVEHTGLITFSKQGVKRASHYHKESTQYSYILEGEIELTTKNIDGSKEEKTILKPGYFSEIPPNIVHTYVSLTPAKMLDMTSKSRLGDGYEDDTIRVDA